MVSLAFSSNGAVLAAGSSAYDESGTYLGTTDVWDVARRDRSAAIPDQGVPGTSTSQGIHAVAVSPDGADVAAADQNGYIYVWDRSGVLVTPHGALQDQNTDGGVLSLAFSSNGRYLAAGDGNGYVNVWDATGGWKFLGTVPNPALWKVTALAFSPDSRLLAEGNGDGETYVWDVSDMLAKGTMPVAYLARAAGGPVASVAFSPDGGFLAVAAGGAPSLWRTSDWQELAYPLTAKSSRGSKSVAFSQDGAILAVADRSGDIYLWSTGTGNPLATLRDPDDEAVDSVAFSPDSAVLAVGAADGNVYLWSMGWRGYPVPLNRNHDNPPATASRTGTAPTTG